MSRIETAAIEGIPVSSLSIEEHNALAILENLPIAEVDRLKNLMNLNTPGVIGMTTLQKFGQLCKEHGFDLSEAGVNTFKDEHKLGNTGAVKGVIGPQTAQVYYHAIVEQATPKSAPAPATADGVRQINEAGLHLIEEFEGLARQLPDGRIAAYRDAVGVPTIGYGHTHGVYMGEVVTREQAQEFLKEDLRQAEAAVTQLVKVPLNDNQFAALVSFVFNLGAGALSHSTLLRELNAKNYQGAANQFLLWTHAGGRVLPGLVRRRRAERQLFLS